MLALAAFLLCLAGAGAAHAPPPLLPVRVGRSLEGHDARRGVSVVLAAGSRCLRVEPGLQRPSAVAWAELDDELRNTGWIQLRVGTARSARVPNDVKTYAAGFLEGLLTATRTSQFYSNFRQPLLRDRAGQRAMGNVERELLQELQYARRRARFRRGPQRREPPDPYWKQVRYLLAQLSGLRDGYNSAAAAAGVRRLRLLDMLLINSHAQLPALLEAYAPSVAASRSPPPPAGAVALAQRGARLRGQSAQAVGVARGARQARLSPAVPEGRSGAGEGAVQLPPGAFSDAAWERRLSRTGHCSAMVRLAPGASDLLVGHSTWDDYGKMTRIFKYYDFGLPGSGAAARLIGFSSYPGCVSSTDDFYLLDSELVVMDTSLEVLNPRLYERVPPFAAGPRVPGFVHLMAVNRLARTGLHWTTLLAGAGGAGAGAGGGAASAQWLVVDFKRFRPGQPPGDNALRLLEQVPGLARAADLSAELRGQGWWASYNRPYLPEVRAASGHAEAERAHGELYSFRRGPRARIFARLAPGVGDLQGMQALMTRNAYPDEGVSPNEPGHAISARLDLAAGPLRLPNGGIDAKVTGRELLRGMRCRAISGPPHGQQPVFRWRDPRGHELFGGWPHFGLPDVWNFSWVSMEPGACLASSAAGAGSL